MINAIAREFPAKSDRTFFPEDDEPDGLLSERVVALIHNIPSQPSATVPLMRIFLEALFSLVLVSASLFSTYWVQNIMQPAYFASLPAQVHAKAPIFADGLRQPDGLWPVRKPTTDDPGSNAYTPEGYMLSGNASGLVVNATISHVYTSVAIEVTVTESGSVPAGDQDGVGIIARDHPSEFDNNLLFTVRYNGDWALGDSGGFGASGHNTAIHTGFGATNTLMVIARGNLYIGYVNNHYVGQYFDEINFAGAAGQIGLVNLESGMTATFTDFTVWQVNAPPALTIV